MSGCYCCGSIDTPAVIDIAVMDYVDKVTFWANEPFCAVHALQLLNGDRVLLTDGECWVETESD